ncbi:MAG: T9SS type A sorting domain-containing protein [Myroides odoratus]|jgi:hypothetical protein|nr:T9SS type A sorting domain-containing protein [Myroides odoratus]
MIRKSIWLIIFFSTILICQRSFSQISNSKNVENESSLNAFTGQQGWPDYGGIRLAEELLKQLCDLEINHVEQVPKGNFNQGNLCFVYDAAGNYIKTQRCGLVALPKDLIVNDSIFVAKKKQNQILSLDEVKKYIIVYPNPTTGPIKVNIEDTVLGMVTKLEVFNKNGGIILTKFVGNTDKEVVFNIEGYPTGSYILKFTLSTQEFFSVNIIKR